ncbi:hypothetical protein M441DRAFT_453333 [Trichoderma asperellum CBS 433.97]|uniref:Uncharacterized protein n=1 Tax=Trichoderma asperellum (strain ATCC 204424 / CBS 433.97 / NBRC 101777) TaxID=1042311 RepID=A0A2T3ZGC8_TRIA4|nr:hypothetical protein M441DRAFT_453333 [Trichoderma asperellum CBS 433.97]PTB43840.1 hypothetical protein M441DRAFT_453333 [Trichoderma asperellum CBS 433.97]
MHLEYQNRTDNAMYAYVLFIRSHLTPYDGIDWDRFKPQSEPNWVPKTSDDHFQFCLLKAIAHLIQYEYEEAKESCIEAGSLLPGICKSDNDQGYKNMMAWGFLLLYKYLIQEELGFQYVFKNIHSLEIIGSCMSVRAVALLQHEKDIMDPFHEQKESEALPFIQNASEDQMKARVNIAHIASSAIAGFFFLLENEDPEETLTPELNRSIYSMLEYVQTSSLLSKPERLLNYRREYQYLCCLFRLKKSWWEKTQISHASFLCYASLSYEFNSKFVRHTFYKLQLKSLLEKEINSTI